MGRFYQPDGRVHGVAFGCRRAADGRWLMVRRSRDLEVFPNRICFPGGGVEQGESQEQACVREAMEELGVRVRPLKSVWRHAFQQYPLTLFGWLAELPEDSNLIVPNPAEIAEVLWLSPQEAAAHPEGVETNPSLIAALEDAIRADR